MSQLESTIERLNHVIQITPIQTAARTDPEWKEILKRAKKSQRTPFELYLQTIPELQSTTGLIRLLLSLSRAAGEISQILRQMVVAKLNTSNTFGDEQLNVDLATHECVLLNLRNSGVVATCSSEEDPTRIDLSGSLKSDCSDIYSVGFDPLDGSSIIDANFAVGSIFSIFPGRELIGQRVGDQRAAAIAQYGPRTTIIFALPSKRVFEVQLDVDGSWFVTRTDIRVNAETKLFAPANLRCSTEDEGYKRLVQYYMDKKYTLRYSGGLVPDFYHILTKSNGIFISPVTKSNKAKLRLVYECASLSMLSQWAGGGAINHLGELMADAIIHDYDQRSGLIIGSTTEVARYQQFRKEFTNHADSNPSQ